ncbi:MAG: hypothetical protein ACLSUM_15180 [Dysosmobacter welbionis]
MKGLDKAEELKELYERVASQYDPTVSGLLLPPRRSRGSSGCGRNIPTRTPAVALAAADGHELLRYLTAAYFKAVSWEIVPGTTYERAILRG